MITSHVMSNENTTPNNTTPNNTTPNSKTPKKNAEQDLTTYS